MDPLLSEVNLGRVCYHFQDDTRDIYETLPIIVE